MLSLIISLCVKLGESSLQNCCFGSFYEPEIPEELK